MIQRTYRLNTQLGLIDALMDISTSEAYRNANARLVQVLEPNCDAGYISLVLEQVAEALPEAEVVGMTLLGPITPDCMETTETIITVLMFESSTLDVHCYDCADVTPAQAAESFNRNVREMSELKGVFFLSSGMDLCPTPFVDAVARAHPDVPVFGAKPAPTASTLTSPRSSMEPTSSETASSPSRSAAPTCTSCARATSAGTPWGASSPSRRQAMAA